MSTLLLKPRLSVDRQCFCQSHVVIKATFLSKRKSEGFCKGKKRRQCQWEHTLLSIFQSLALLWNELPTVCMCMSWPLLSVYMYLCMACYWIGVSKRGCITHCQYRNWLVLAVISANMLIEYCYFMFHVKCISLLGTFCFMHRFYFHCNIDFPSLIRAHCYTKEKASSKSQGIIWQREGAFCYSTSWSWINAGSEESKIWSCMCTKLFYAFGTNSCCTGSAARTFCTCSG